MIIIGVDPGIAKAAPGAVAFFDAKICRIVAIYDMPTLELSRSAKRSLDYHALAKILAESRAGHAFVEKSWNRPGEGHSGALVGCYMAVLMGLTTLGIPWTAVAPQRWKRALDVSAAKDAARARASQLLPDASHHWPLVKHHGRAEASLLALYGFRQFGMIGEGDKQ